MKKAELAKKLIKENINIFMCPICKNKMVIEDLNSVVCLNKHCFDLSKNGYINLLLKSVKTEYDKKMLESRNIICKSGFFNTMTEQISNLIINELNKIGFGNIKILDAGCGEGSHLVDILYNLNNRTQTKFQGVGIDISKEGIQIASREYSNIIWCVADLAQNSFLNKQFNIVLNIFSHSNYSEFNRIIADDGILIKVIPGSEYLCELRSVFYDKTNKHTYSNEKVLNHFSKNFNILDTQQILYSVRVNKENLGHIIKMTPLSWGTSNENIEKVLKMDIKNITVNLTVILGKKTN